MIRTTDTSGKAKTKPARREEKPVLLIKANLSAVPENPGYDPYDNPGSNKAASPSRRPRASR